MNWATNITKMEVSLVLWILYYLLVAFYIFDSYHSDTQVQKQLGLGLIGNCIEWSSLESRYFIIHLGKLFFDFLQFLLKISLLVVVRALAVINWNHRDITI